MACAKEAIVARLTSMRARRCETTNGIASDDISGFQLGGVYAMLPPSK